MSELRISSMGNLLVKSTPEVISWLQMSLNGSKNTRPPKKGDVVVYYKGAEAEYTPPQALQFLRDLLRTAGSRVYPEFFYDKRRGRFVCRYKDQKGNVASYYIDLNAETNDATHFLRQIYRIMIDAGIDSKVAIRALKSLTIPAIPVRKEKE